MAKPNQYIFTYKEIATALIKEQGITEGLWGIYIEFGIQGANINLRTGPDEKEIVGLIPAAIVPIVRLGLQRFNTPNDLTVDAAEVNLKSRAATSQPTRKSKKRG
ncbi:MAG: hypothetical protein ACREA2_19100 [Blastocatellia bacterium]